METMYMSIDRRMDKDVVHIYKVILLSNKKEWINAIYSDMDGPRDHHTEWSKSDRERQTSYDIAYTWNLKKKKRHKWTYMQKRNWVTSVENKFMATKEERVWRDTLEDWDIHSTLYKTDN